MSTVNILSFCAFVGVLILGMMVMTAQDLRGKRPTARIKERIKTSTATANAVARERLAHQEQMFTLDVPQNRFQRWWDPKITRLGTVAGKKGVRLVILAALGGELIALAMVYFMQLPAWSKPLLIVVLPIFVVYRTYHFLVNRFRTRFLSGFPDVIDLIVRAVRAGVPVTQVMSTAADECEEPLKSEFRAMGDSMKVGRELEETLGIAMRRIEIADFSFFCVCLLLQRETGGQLGETLDNLSAIVRSRREVRQKTKALTAEARITTKILAAIPVCIMGGMYMLNKTTMVEFLHSAPGHKIMTYSVLSVVGGILLINKLSKLNTSR